MAQVAIEIIKQVLAPDNAPNINGVYAERRVSKAILQNLFQGLVEKGGKGVSDNFVSEEEANNAVTIAVNRILPIKMKPREHGASKNGGAFSNKAHYTETVQVSIDILTLLDDPIIIPRVSQDRIPTDLLAEHIKIFSDRSATVINGATAAAKFLATYLADAGDRNIIELSASDVSNKLVLQRFEEANDKLDEGDIDNGIDIFPEDSRVAVFKIGHRALLKAQGVLVLGGANVAYQIATKDSGLSAGDKKNTLDTGFWGTIDGVDVYGLSNESLLHCDGFLGFPDGELKASPVRGYLSSSYANARGVSTVQMTKVVDTRGGQGIELQPLLKLGTKTWYPKGNVFIVDDDDYDPYTEVKTLFTGVTGINFLNKAAGSRYYADLDITAISTSAFTVAGTAKDDNNVDHLKGLAYVVTTAPVKTVHAFYGAYTAASAEADACSSGVSKSFGSTQTAGHYVNVLAVADDGSLAIISKVIPS